MADVVPSATSAPPEQPQARQWSLVTWNILADRHINPAWYPGVARRALRGPLRASGVVRALCRCPADIIALQEVEPRQFAALRAALPHHHAAFAPHNGEGLALFVRADGLHATIVKQATRGKVVLVAAVEGGPRVAVVHLPWAARGAPAPRPGVRHLGFLRDHHPDIVVGDFNAGHGWPEREALHAAGYRDASPRGPTFRSNGLPQSIDVIATGPGWDALDVRVMPLGPHRRLPDPRNPSDHLPVRARLSRTRGAPP